MEAYKETYDKISMVCDDTRPCSPHVDEGFESLLPCNIFEAKSSEEDCYEYKEDMDRQEHDAMDEELPKYDMDGSDDYWNFIDNPTCENLIQNLIYVINAFTGRHVEAGGIPSMLCLARGVSIHKFVEVQSTIHP